VVGPLIAVQRLRTIAMMIASAPMMTPPSFLPVGQQDPLERSTALAPASSGGPLSVVPDAPRPVAGPGQSESGQGSNERANADPQPGRSDRDLAAELRFGIALDQSLNGLSAGDLGIGAEYSARSTADGDNSGNVSSESSANPSAADLLQQRIDSLLADEPPQTAVAMLGSGGDVGSSVRQSVSEFA